MKIFKKKKWILSGSFFLIIIAFLFFLWQFPVYKTLMPGYHSIVYTPSKYNTLLIGNHLQVEKFNLSSLSVDAKNNKAENLFIHHISNMFPYWYGTRWNYNGTTQIPGKGSIACGYFVTTVLQQSGLKINRIELAQFGSEQMILSICNKKNINRFPNYSMMPFMKYIKNSGEGIYLLGLDNHTGFIWNDGEEIFFVHASGRFPYCVKKEKAIESITLWKSKYKVISKISSDTLVLNKWLNAEVF
ncbi:MAG: hypothetical protein RL065_254 [Bacteroidota bacterium]|jgi:hypothetical protein